MRLLRLATAALPADWRTLLASIAHLAMALLLCLPAQAAPLTAYTVPVFPWTFPDQPERGVSPEILRFLFDRAGVTISLSTLPYVRAINGLKSGENVAAVLIPDAERDEFASQLCQIGQIRSGVLYKRQRYKQLAPSHLSGMVVGVPRGTRALDKLKSLDANLYPLESVEQGLRMLMADRLDATFVSRPGSISALEQAGLKSRDYHWLEIDVQPVVIYISHKSPLMQDQAAMARLKAACEGPGQARMAALLKRYQ
ncbi:hypothetical protein GCM10007907_39410 [Chitinimonas prasina]|uniref:Solute-binding protein family 3/N-terminal domain-containing protein n=1 Tax=Chitinimonas prasina TaxID=1434937 RepID=A0ABQ5YP83_9NEIS|nr:transporter substrate-binding domain-containing protein [Chitinimonas prasina]GLR15151.1 hypothetical protein GCM10007907_39410 [Chitinimonas prasina]